MNIRLRTLVIGLAAGAASSLLACVLVAVLQWPWGGVLGVLAGAAIGTITALSAGIWAVGPIAHRLVELLDHSLQTPRSTGWNELDRALQDVHGQLASLHRAGTELDDLARLAGVLGKTVAENGFAPPVEPKAAVLSLLDQVRHAADRVAEDAQALDAVTERITTGAWDQSEAVGRTTSTVETLSDRIDQISHNAEAAAEAGQRARAEAKRGIEQIQGLIEGIDRLRAHVETNGRKVRRLGDRSVEIGTIVDLIDGISGRTDMLALNATIESVRAGEHGRGFAVVAEEIRKLAERTAAATREIGALVEAIQADTNESIAALSQEQAEVEEEAQRVREAGAALERISEVAEHSARLVEGISHSATDQVHSTHELVRAMQQISEVTQQTLAGSATAREHVRQLAQRCDRLHRLSAWDSHATGRVNGNGHRSGTHNINGHGGHGRRSTALEQAP